MNMGKFGTGWRVTSGFAFLGYAVALVMYFLPPAWGAASPELVYALCPPAIFTITVDPSFSTVAILLGPLNALLYACTGFVIGFAIEECVSVKRK